MYVTWQLVPSELLHRLTHPSCLFARRKQALDEVYEQCLALGCSNVLRLAGDITNPDDLVRVRDEVIKGER
jgi:type IV pilus biogenesis protein CpaD/CtpE